jgi:hypothetical protein
MQRLRALYEDSVVPVREIARIAGVTERTLYKYVQKGGWRRRYCWSAASDGAVPKPPPLTPPHQEEGMHRFAPVKGAGGRFIRREDAGLPFARGIKALDPDGAQRAAAKAEAAAALSARAAHLARLSMQAREAIAAQKQCERQKAKQERAEDARVRSAGKLMAMLDSLTRARRAPQVNPRADAVADKMQWMILDMVERLMLSSPLP